MRHAAPPCLRNAALRPEQVAPPITWDSFAQQHEEVAMAKAIRVGLVGAHPTRGWAQAAHLPALAGLPEFHLAAVATTRMDSAAETARRHGVPQAFDDARRMIAEAALDAVIVAVKVPYHREIVLDAIAAGLHVFCEWPLGLDVAEAEAMHLAAEARGVRHIVGLQSHVHPVLREARRLIAEGRIGRLLSATLVSSLRNWWPHVPESEAYRFDAHFGATGLTVPGGHSLDAMLVTLGQAGAASFERFAATLGAPHGEMLLAETGERRRIAAPTQLALTGRFANDAIISLHVKPDVSVPSGIRFEINGTRGDLLIRTQPPIGRAPVGIQRAELLLEGAFEDTPAFEPLPVPDPEARLLAPIPTGAPRYTARLLHRFARAIETGDHAEPSFATALDRHRLIEAATNSSVAPGASPSGA
jgi:predicted dehydrogenase